jgi:hypothetical protein
LKNVSLLFREFVSGFPDRRIPRDFSINENYIYLFIVSSVLCLASRLLSLTLQPDSRLGLLCEHYGGLLNLLFSATVRLLDMRNIDNVATSKPAYVLEFKMARDMSGPANLG